MKTTPQPMFQRLAPVILGGFCAAATLLGTLPAAHADLLINENFGESVADNSPMGGAPGWHAYALFGGAVTDYTSSTPNGNYPTLSHSGVGAGSGGVGYLVMGAGNVVSNVLVWVDSAATLQGRTISDIAFYTKNNAPASTERIVVRIGGQWYASTITFSDTAGNGSWALNNFTYDTAAASWRTLKTNTLTLGAVLSSPLPNADVTAVGAFGSIQADSGKIRIDEWQVNGFLSNAPPVVSVPVATPGTNILAGTTLTLSVTATGAPLLAYQWRKDGINLTNGPTLTGAATSWLTISNATPADNGSYDVAVSNPYGTNASSVVSVAVAIAVAAKVDFSGYDANSAVNVSSPDTNTLTAVWSDRNGVQHRVQFNLLPGQVLLRSLESAPAGGAFATVAKAVDVKYRVTLGNRHRLAGWPYIFFDSVDANTPAPVAYLSTLNPVTVRVVSESPQRTRIVFSTLTMGPYRGDLTCCLYEGSPFIHIQASMLVDDPWVAYIYDALFYANFTNVTYLNTSGAFQTTPAASLSQTAPGEPAKVVGKYRTIMGTVNGGNGTLAVMSPPHTGVYPTDFSDNLGWLQAGKTFIGTKMSFSADGRYRPWVDAPQGATQRMDSFLFFNTDAPAATLTNILTYTHGDSFKQIPGHYTLAEHFHPEFTWNDLNGGDSLTPFKQVMKSLGVQMLQPMEFHGPGHPMNDTTNRLAELNRMFTLFQAQSDNDFLLIPGEEYNNFYGGHWSYMFPRPVYFTGWSGQGGRAYKQTNVVAGGITQPLVYQVGDASHMLQLLQDEGGLAWSSHPRVKASQLTPDSFMNNDYYRDDTFLAGDWKAMPLDLSKDRLGFRSLQLMDDTAQMGYRKSMLGEVDTFLLNSTHEIYAHMNVNYLELPALPPKTNWSSAVDCVRNGQFFTTTGEVLIHSWNATGSNVTATVEWYFPPAFAEITWGDDAGVHKLKQSLSDQIEFATQQLTLPADLTSANWVRLEVWDIARNGAFTQLHWYNPPGNPTVVTGQVMNFSLIDSDTDAAVPGYDPIPNYAVLDRSKLPANLTIRANIRPLIMDSVTIGLDGASASRTQWPYCLTACAVNPGLTGSAFYDYAPSVLNVGSRVISATPWRGATAGTPLSLTFSVVDTVPPPATNFIMDGVMDSAGYRIATKAGLYAAVRGTKLYVAAPATDGNDKFIFITDAAGSLGSAPWSKAGQIAFNISNKPYLAQNGATRLLGWSNGGAAAQCPASVNLGWMEGTLDLAEMFGTVPSTVSIAVVKYAAGNGGALVPASQVPAGNGNGTLEASEFLVIPVPAIRDDDFDGTPDVLESNPAFTASFSKNPGMFVVHWPAVPGQSYQVMSCDYLPQPLQLLSGSVTAGEGVFSMSYTDQPPPAVSQRYYRVKTITQP